MKGEGGSTTSVADAVDNAIARTPRSGNEPWTYEVLRSLVVDGGVVARTYNVEVRITGAGVEP